MWFTRGVLFSHILAALSACSSPGPPGERGKDATAKAVSLSLEGATLLDPESSERSPGVVIVRDGRIACVGSADKCRAPEGARSVDLRGLFIGPGLIDAHVHYGQTAWVDGRPDAIDLRSRYPYDSVMEVLHTHPQLFHRAQLCSGVTSVFDVGGFPWSFDIARASREAGDGPRVLAAGPLLATIQVDPQMAGQFAFMSNDSAVRAAVREHKAQGADAIKVWYIQVPDSSRSHMRAMLKAAGDEARKAGLRLVVHATELPSAKEAVAAGAAVLVHNVETGTMDSAFFAAAKRQGTILVPTLTVLEGYADVFLGRSPGIRYPLECVDPGTRRKLETVLSDSLRSPGMGFWNSPEFAQLRATSADNLLRAYKAGIPIALGTDAGNPGTAHGPSVYREMEAMQGAGMPAAAVFASATSVAARALALGEELGSLAVGKRADLVVFGADPTVDIRNARQVRFVVRNGVLHSKDELVFKESEALNAPRPIDAVRSLWTEEMTWMEVRDLIAAGWTTVIVGTGGVEQNGPYVAGGKHNYVLQTVMPAIARAIPRSLLAPIVRFVPEGRIEPAADGHMRFPGTIGVEEATFEALLTDIARSYRAGGFKDIILIGDSGGNQEGMRNVAAALNERWTREGSNARVHFLAEYYQEDMWSYDFLKKLGITQIDETPGQPRDQPGHTRNGIHDDVYYEAQIAVQDPSLIRWPQRERAGLLSLHGVDLRPLDRLVDIGRKLAQYRAEITARAFTASQRRLRPPA